MGFTRNIERDRAALGPLLDRLGLPGTLLSLLLGHAEAIRAANSRLGLVAPGEESNLVPRHTADSLLFALVRAPRPGERWLDVGSGAGFPGLVLACCYPDCAFTLLEPLKRRAGFLSVAGADLGLANVAVDDRRVEDFEGAGFDVAVARALSAPEKALNTLVRALRPGGEAIVALGSNAQPEGLGRIVELEDLGFVDSAGRFSMMTREG